MAPDISFLPEELRRKEEELKRQPAPPSNAPEGLAMHLPMTEGEDIEVIEVDEGEISEVLAGEPLLSRVLFKTSSFFEELKDSLFHPRLAEPPPKLPPQFFKPPAAKPRAAPGLVPLGGAKPQPSVAGEAKPKARIMPEAQAPRRVRVIKRIRKSVRVSFLEDEELRLAADIPRRRFTLIVTAVVFLALVGGSYALLTWQGDRARTNLSDVNGRISAVETKITERQTAWSAYQDLEPRLKALGVLLDGHVAPTRIFYGLENNTVPDVSYSSFTLSPDGRVTLSVTAASFESAARQIVALRRSGLAADVQAMGYQAAYDAKSGVLQSVNFQIAMTLAPAVMSAASVATVPTP